MSIDYLESLERALDNGQDMYACPGSAQNRWHFSTKPEEVRKQAQRVADGRKSDVPIYKLISKLDAVTGDSFLICRKLLPPGPAGDPRLEWALVDTREAADTMRDVSEGPSPYFGATPFEVCKAVVSND